MDEKKVTGEFERTAVPKESQKGATKFWGMYAGEHAAGTEFMIGPLFLLNGVSLQNIFWGLLVGNFSSTFLALSLRTDCSRGRATRYTII